MLADLEALAPPVVVCVTILIAVLAFLRREMGPPGGPDPDGDPGEDPAQENPAREELAGGKPAGGEPAGGPGMGDSAGAAHKLRED